MLHDGHAVHVNTSMKQRRIRSFANDTISRLRTKLLVSSSRNHRIGSNMLGLYRAVFEVLVIVRALEVALYSLHYQKKE